MQRIIHSLHRRGPFVVAIALVALGLAWPDSALAQGKRGKRGKKAPTSTLVKTKAKSWEVLAFGTVDIPSMQDISPYLWAYSEKCQNLESDLARRQCLGLRAARRAQIAGKKFHVRGDSRSYLAGKYDAGAKGSQFKVYSCFSCARAIKVKDASLYVVGQGQSMVFGTQILGPVIKEETMPFKTPEAAAAWKKDVAPRLRSDYVVSIHDEQPFWQRGGVFGLTMQVHGYRIYDPCTGKIVAAVPKAKNLPRNEQACTGEDLLALQRAREAANRPKLETGPKLPPKLTPKDIQTALAPATTAARQCFSIYGVAGEAKFRIKISGAGKITEIEQTGYFRDTPTGECMEDAIKATTFPQTQKASTTVNYPFVLR